jgi:hypothetical protein
MRRLGRKARVAIVGGVTLILTAGIGLTGVAMADTNGVPHYELWVTFWVHSMDHDDLSPNEKCDEGAGLMRWADLFPDDPARQVDGKVWESQCDDGVKPIIDLTASLHEDGSARVVGDLKMWSEFCVFNNTLDPCSDGDFNGNFVVKHIDLDIQPGGNVSICPTCKADHKNTVDFQELTLKYSTLGTGPTD